MTYSPISRTCLERKDQTMKKNRLLITLVLMSLWHVATEAQQGGHPRLFFSASDTATISARTRQTGDASQLYGEVLQPISHYTINQGSFWPPKFNFYENLIGLAFAYVVSHRQEYADRAKAMIFDNHSIDLRRGMLLDHWPGGGRGLRKKVLTLAIGNTPLSHSPYGCLLPLVHLRQVSCSRVMP